MGESRGELLAWLNGSLNFPCKRIEECGTGVVYFFILDSIYADIPLQKVNFDARQEYEFINNFKLLQSLFDKKGILYNIPIEKLVKCKFQDNLGFLQRIKKFWGAQRRSNDNYDAMSKLACYDPNLKRTSDAHGSIPCSSQSADCRVGSKKLNNRQSLSRVTGGLHPQKKISINRSIAENNLKNDSDTFESGETEANDFMKQIKFYYWKLCSIEGVLKKFYSSEGAADPLLCLEEIKTVLYETEEGFEIPTTEDAEKK